jgi:hypothetical protein
MLVPNDSSENLANNFNNAVLVRVANYRDPDVENV